jgi:hypothetical protein
MKIILIGFGIFLAYSTQVFSAGGMSQADAIKVLMCTGKIKCVGYDGYGGPCSKGYGGGLYDGYGGPCYDGYGGALNKGYGGALDNGYGGNCNDGYGGECYAGYGGNCYEGYTSSPKVCPVQCYTACQ